MIPNEDTSPQLAEIGVNSNCCLRFNTEAGEINLDDWYGVVAWIDSGMSGYANLGPIDAHGTVGSLILTAINGDGVIDPPPSALKPLPSNTFPQIGGDVAGGIPCRGNPSGFVTVGSAMNDVVGVIRMGCGEGT